MVREIPKGESLRAIQSARLTCRALSQIATPILFPVLRVSIDHQSIADLEQISENPAIAAHVRGVVVNVAAFRSDMASDIALFKKTCLDEIDALFDRLDSAMEFRLQEGDHEDEDIKQYYRIDDAHDLLREEWASAVSTATSDDSNDDARGKYQATYGGASQGAYGDFLLRSHKEYARRYRQQLASLHDAQAMQHNLLGHSPGCPAGASFTFPETWNAPRICTTTVPKLPRFWTMRMIIQR
ncbi:hypothetical protein LMH87_000116 [Akanthomyces muscarius]|uniref:Uncharacterized protein n=1 Tax=Akanthomyces muscarius TaxID=2231603 RepID=A0A9W8QEN8_AKAMU|nr:hypothetical protein LMH87_000116 [Akanthomyces muscarius]KAJ4154841.1 hypothetical protein LMH87_000116 [Akanthomyces muscarius]